MANKLVRINTAVCELCRWNGAWIRFSWQGLLKPKSAWFIVHTSEILIDFERCGFRGQGGENKRLSQWLAQLFPCFFFLPLKRINGKPLVEQGTLSEWKWIAILWRCQSHVPTQWLAHSHTERQIYTRTTNPVNQFARQEQCMSTTMVIDSRHSYRDWRSEKTKKAVVPCRAILDALPEGWRKCGYLT